MYGWWLVKSCKLYLIDFCNVLDLGAIVSRFSGLILLINSAKLIFFKVKEMLELLDVSKMVCCYRELLIRFG